MKIARTSFRPSRYSQNSPSRYFSESASAYIEDWFAAIKKSKEFYETHEDADNGRARRCYFYNIDLQGRLFLEETMPKNIATSIKDVRFLDFFVRRLQRINTRHVEYMKDNNIPVDDYPFVSPCGKELNFIRPAASPIVFHSLVDDSITSGHGQDLVFGGSLVQPFDETGIAVSERSGRLYHKLDTHSQNQKGDSPQYGLIRSSVAVALSEMIVPLEGRNEGDESGLGFETRCNGLLPIPWLPGTAEPGSWAMPFEGAA